MSTVVLGAGPVGLVVAYLLEAEICVEERAEGGDPRIWEPTFIRRTEATEELLIDLDVPFKPTKLLFGCLGDDGPSAEFSAEERIEYHRRSLGLVAGSPVEVPSSATNPVGEFETFDVSVAELVEVLRNRVEVLGRKAVLVDVVEDAGERKVPLVRVELSDGRELLTRRLVNTIPAPVFDRLIRHEGAFFRNVRRTWETTRRTLLRAPMDVCGDVLRRARYEDGFRHLYVVSTDRIRYPFDRVDFVDGDDDSAVFEFGGDHQSFQLGDVVDPDAFRVKGLKRDTIEFGGAVRHVGRLARWSREIRLHDVVEELWNE